MIYKVPCPTRTNGVRLLKEGNQICVQYETGTPHVGGMAYDSALGAMARNVTIQPKARRKLRLGSDAFPRPFMSRKKDMQKPLDAPDIADDDEDDDDTDAIVTKLMSYLNDKLTPEQLSSVAAILGSGDDDAPDSDAGEPRNYQAADRRRAARLAADVARQRPPTPAENQEFDRLFPGAKSILRR
jgi:hypothetical protein